MLYLMPYEFTFKQFLTNFHGDEKKTFLEKK